MSLTDWQPYNQYYPALDNLSINMEIKADISKLNKESNQQHTSTFRNFSILLRQQTVKTDNNIVSFEVKFLCTTIQVKEAIIVIIIPSNKVKVSHWLIKVQHVGFFCPTGLQKHNINFSSKEFEGKATKDNNRLTLQKRNITRCCTSRHTSHVADVVPSNPSHVAMKPWWWTNVLSLRADHVYNLWILYF